MKCTDEYINSDGLRTKVWESDETNIKIRYNRDDSITITPFEKDNNDKRRMAGKT